MTRRIASPGPQASQSLSRRPPFLEDFPIRSTKAAKYSPIRARKNPCATGIGTVFSQTLVSSRAARIRGAGFVFPREVSLQRGANRKQNKEENDHSISNDPPISP